MMQSRVEIQDPLGFTKETEALLTGLNCTNLKQFKKRKINLDDLRQLTDEDLAVLEVGDNFDYESFHKLKESLKRKYDRQMPGPSPQDAIKIIKTMHKELKPILIYLKCVYLELSKNKEDFFIDNNKNMRFSEALAFACDHVLQRIDELEKAAKMLQIATVNPKNSSKSNKMKYTLAAAGIGVIVVFCILR